jgi:hypothetical protein
MDFLDQFDSCRLLECILEGNFRLEKVVTARVYPLNAKSLILLCPFGANYDFFKFYSLLWEGW